MNAVGGSKLTLISLLTRICRLLVFLFLAFARLCELLWLHVLAVSQFDNFTLVAVYIDSGRLRVIVTDEL